MATVVAVDCTDGALLAGDRRVVEGGTVAGSRRHVFDFGDVGVAAVGDDPDGFRRRLDAALRRYADDRGRPSVDAVARMAAEVAGEAGVEALVVARDGEGRATVHSVADGVLVEGVAARGSAAEVVLGPLEAVDEVDLEAARSQARNAFRAAASRDTGTDEDIDVFELRDARTGETV